MDTFLKTYKNLNSGNLESLTEIYTPDIHFIDPAHEIHGLDNLTNYFAKLYANITSIDFQFTREILSEGNGYVQWQMRFSHAQLKRGKEITVPGASFLEFSDEGKVYFHRDYFDLGAMIYQHLPLLGRIITSINGRLGS